ncbi:MAG: type I-E CRISPR-associated protein Cas5/CasD [Eubacteriales bacterium]|nr:type I-E CRISPR-associated protein Cas5/CasD [Eubacteriales bacterium]
MATLLLRLAAPLQSWGVDSKFETRRTGREPSKSGVIGMVAAALGLRRDQMEELQALSQLRFGVRVDQEGSLLRDFHIAQAQKASYLTYRYYLEDAIFLVGLESEDISLLQQLDDALRHPVFPLFLGRRSCPPTFPLVLGIRETELVNALRGEPWLISPSRQAKASPNLRLITDATPGQQSFAIQRDVPVSFDPHHRQFTDRAIFTHPRVTMISKDETIHNPMQELEGD